MKLHCQEFPTEADARAAQAEFPRCGTCKFDHTDTQANIRRENRLSGVKVQFLRGKWLLLCTANPHHHDIWNGEDDD